MQIFPKKTQYSFCSQGSIRKKTVLQVHFSKCSVLNEGVFFLNTFITSLLFCRSCKSFVLKKV